MPLDDLVSVIETLQQRIRDHSDTLRQNETRTRMALIDPLLRALGWDVANPSLVMPEYDVSGKRADYALLSGNSVVVFLEAKRLDEPLSNHRSQIVAYASELGIKFPALTNGNEWEIYDNSKLVPIEQRRILNLSINGIPAHQCALQLLLLWRPNLASGQSVAANEPILNASTRKPAPVEEVIKPVNIPPINDGWQSLASIQNYGDVKFPASLRFPDEGEREISNWIDVLKKVAEWQIRVGNLKVEKCPIPSSPNSRTRYIIHTLPEHSNRKSFENPYKLSNGYFLEAHGGDWARKNSKGIVEQLGGDTASVWLKFN